MSAKQTNPRYKAFVQSTYTAGDEGQFYEAIKRYDINLKTIDTSLNKFNDVLSIHSYDQLDYTKYDDLTSRAVYNTFSYMFHKFKKGIFLSIKDGKLNFLPFSNAQYRNEWSHLIKVDTRKYSSIQSLIDRSSKIIGYTPKQKHIPIDEWRSNDAMFRYDLKKTEGDTNIELFKDLFTTLCNERDLPDIEFFINKRDYPLLKQDDTEPYENLYGTKFQKLVSHRYEKYSPIFSCSTGYGFADVLCPTYEDWARAKYQRDNITLPNMYKAYPVIKHNVPWASKKGLAVFRGSTTGSGVTPGTNQRLKAFEMGSLYPGYLDIGITKWNNRIRKHISSKYLEIIERSTYPTVKPLSLQEQANTYKYILTLEGHVAAYRLSYELSSGSLILLADSKWKIWYSRFLKPFVHYIPIKNDLSDLIEKIEWCRSNDDKCQRIVANALDFYNKYLGVDGILDYLQITFLELSRMIGGYSWLPNLLELSLSEEKKLLKTFIDRDNLPAYKYPISAGPRCIGKLKAMASALSRTDKLEFVKNIITQSTFKVDCVKTNGFSLARKTVDNIPYKQNEQAHEAFIGLFAVNSLVSQCPNFAYVYGYKDESPTTYMEFINGPTLSEWIASDNYNEKDLFNILCGLNLALEVAQLQCAFVHYDLTPWNIIVQTLNTPVQFDYNIETNFPVRFTSNIVPVMIDYGKSRAVVHEPSFGLVDRGFINFYKTRTRSIDTMTLLYSTINCLLNNKKIVPQILYNFIKDFNLPTNVKSFPTGWPVIDYTNTSLNIVKYLTPMAFVNYFSKYIQLTPTVKGDYKQKMNKGNCFLEESIMKTGNPNLAVSDLVDKLYRQTIPTSNNAVVNLMIQTLITNRIMDLDVLVETSNNDQIKNKYRTIRQKITAGSDITSDDIIMDFPSRNYLEMDYYLTPEELAMLKDEAVISKENWISIKKLCVEVSTLEPLLDIFGVLTDRFDSFDYLNEIASNNTVLWINSVV